MSMLCNLGLIELRLKDLLSNSVEEVRITEFSDMEDRIHLRDAREKNKFEVSHIRGATWAGYDDFSMDRLGKPGGEVIDEDGHETESMHAFHKALGIWLKKRK
ncbi:MAG: hypothetical protein GY751_23565 [Bacteroidetes bacterium]|nr:hypothetical protein [Bacteroidota bacterium]